MRNSKSKIGILLLGLVSVFLAIVLGTDNIEFVYTLYLITSFASFALAYFESIGTTKLGFGVTRFQSYKSLIQNLLQMIFLLLALYIYAQTLIVIVYGKQNLLAVIEIPMILFLSLLIFAHGQLGAFFGNIRIYKPLGMSIFIGLFIYTILELYIITNKTFIIIIYSLGSIVLFILNYVIIKNIKIERS